MPVHGDAGEPAEEVTGRIVFLVGARRSGTNWLHGLMAMHPRVVKMPSETHLFYTLAELQQRFQHGVIGSPNTGSTYLPRADLISFFRSLCDRAFGWQLTASGSTDTLLVERTPLHAKHLDLIKEVYPDAPVVHLIRDGRAVAASLAAQDWGPDSAALAAAEWADTVSSARSNRPSRYLEIRYEDLERDPETAMVPIFEFLGLDVSDDLRARWRAVADKPVNRTAGARDADGRRALTDADLGDVEAVAGALLRELGYAPELKRRQEIRHEASPAPRTRRSWRGRKRRSDSTRPDVPSDAMQRVVDHVMAALETRDLVALEEVLHPAVELRINADVPGVDLVVGASQAAAALMEAAAPVGSQVRGVTFAGRPAFTVLWSHQHAGGTSHRMFVVRIDAALSVTQIDFFALGESSAAQQVGAATRRST